MFTFFSVVYFTDVSKELTTSIIRAMMMEAVNSCEPSVKVCQTALHSIVTVRT
jgi:hypothetical protein